MKTSGWCAVAPGTTHTKRQHDACRGVCGCEAFGGHVGAQIPAVERESRRTLLASGVATCENWDTTKRDPSRVFGDPQLRSLDGQEGTAQ